MERVSFEKQRLRTKGRDKRKGPKETSKEWILRKKEVCGPRSPMILFQLTI